MTAARFDDTPPFNCHITFTRSRNKGTSWASPVGLESSAGGCGTGASQVVHGARVSAGLGRNVVVAWYNSGPDGWLAGNFSIQTRASGNRGITWAPTVNAVTDSFEAPFRLGPNATYQPWWGTMFPDVEIDEKGRAHIVYTHDPEQGGTTAEEGDIRYIRSTNSAYSTWSAPITLNDDESGKAQGWPAMEVKATDRGRVVHVVWEDHRLSAPDNLLYDIFYAQRERGEWSANSRITTATSMSDSSVFGDNFDLTLIGSRGRNDGECVYAIWTDRRHQASILALEDNVFGARICH